VASRPVRRTADGVTAEWFPLMMSTSFGTPLTSTLPTRPRAGDEFSTRSPSNLVPTW